MHSNWCTVTLRGKRLSPPVAAFLEYHNHSPSASEAREPAGADRP